MDAIRRPKQIERLIADHGPGIAVVWTERVLAACLAHELPDVLDRWLDAEGIPFSARARAAGYAGLRAALAHTAGTPVVALGPSSIRLCWYDRTQHALGPWVWSYVEN